jgi:hypothetical protein
MHNVLVNLRNIYGLVDVAVSHANRFSIIQQPVSSIGTSPDFYGKVKLKGHSHEKVCEIIPLNDRLGPN